MNFIDHTLGYLREALSNYEDDGRARNLFKLLSNHHYENEEEFVETLESEEIQYLDSILETEIRYAKQAQDEKRLKELNEVQEQLFP